MDYYKNKEYVSNSMLNWLDVSKEYFLHRFFRETEEDESKFLEDGKLLHRYIENPEAFIISDTIKPGEKTALFLEKYHETGDIKRSKELSGISYTIETLEKTIKDPKNEAYLAFLETSKDKICLDASQSVSITEAIKALNNNEFCQKYLLNSPETAKLNGEDISTELEAYFVSEINNVKIKRKAKIDRVIVNHKTKVNTIIDLKTTSKNPFGKFIKIRDTGLISVDFHSTGWFNSYINYGYYRQGPYYIDAMKSINNYENRFFFVVVSLKAPYSVAVYELSPNHYSKYGKHDLNTLLEEYGQLKTQLDLGTYVSNNQFTIDKFGSSQHTS